MEREAFCIVPSLLYTVPGYRPIESNATSRALHPAAIEANGVHAVFNASTARAFIDSS